MKNHPWYEAHFEGPKTSVYQQHPLLSPAAAQALFSSSKPKTFQDSSSHQILRHMHRALNIDENKN